jgi:hypothetical protein
MGWRTRLVIGLLAWPALFVFTIISELAHRATVVSSVFLVAAILSLLVGLVFPPWALISWARRGDRAERTPS